MTRPEQTASPRPVGQQVGRREEDPTTRQALVSAALTLFTERGYAATGLEAVVTRAGLSKGALYHHFSGKRALFAAAVERVERDSAARVERALREHEDPWERAAAGLSALLAVVREPAYRRVVVQDGPSVLGYERVHEQEERSAHAVVAHLVQDVLGTGPRRLDAAMLDTLTRILVGAVSAAGESVATSQDSAEAAARVESAIGLILAGLRSQQDGGVTGRRPDGDR